ncbi:Molybdopterin biosynthesis protein MoeA [gamma proteobacterium IMCC2047]|nr:Molybdopterin biosynthesis protein MoeA [gamma proteobacterium IMCC2047]
MSLLPVENALQIFKDNVTPITETEKVSIRDALGRVLAEDVCSGLNVPPEDNSAMDGYALCTDDLVAGQRTRLNVSQQVFAGHEGEAFEPGTAVRIFTGGHVPVGANAVVMQEDCEVDGDTVLLPESVKVGNNIRRQGQDIKQGSTVLEKGQKLHPQHLGLLASVGIVEVSVYRRLKVAALSTGDELMNPGEALAEGQIYNSNRFIMAGMIERLGFEFVDGGIVRDDLQVTKDKLGEAAQQADVVITSGGVSVGDADYVKPAVDELGHLDVWSMAMKPGKPVAFGHINNTPFFGLPGNPVSVFVGFLVLIKPYLQATQGMGWIEPISWKIPAGFAKKRSGVRQEYIRVRVVQNEQGQAQLETFHTQDSGVLRSTVFSDALAIIPPHTEVKPGDMLDTLLLDELFNR